MELHLYTQVRPQKLRKSSLISDCLFLSSKRKEFEVLMIEPSVICMNIPELGLWKRKDVKKVLSI
jgi:hypothetical protein